MLYRFTTYALSLTVATLLICVGTASLGGILRDAEAATLPRAVALSDATVRPDRLVSVKPGQSVRISRQCGGRIDTSNRPHWTRDYVTEFQAYRWNGSKLSAQHWNPDNTVSAWLTQNFRPVTFDGLTVANGTLSTILFAGWCS